MRIQLKLDRIEQLLKDQGLTKVDLSRKCGCHSCYLTSIVSCGGTCRLETATKFANALGVPVEEIALLERVPYRPGNRAYKSH